MRLPTRIFAALAGAAILFMMAVTSIDVFGRFFFNAPLTGAFVTEITMALVIFGGCRSPRCRASTSP